MKLAACLLAAVMLVGCAGEKLKERPARAQLVLDLGQQGQAAYFKGDLPRAARLFERALSEAMHIEDSAGVATMSINLARVTRESGDSVAALKQLNAVSPWHRSKLGARTTQELDLFSAVLLADLSRTDEALGRLQAVRDHCQSVCESAIGVDSLQARLLLEKGDAAGAAQITAAAITRHRGHINQLELANLLRVQGEALLALGEYPSARQSLEQALGIDKSLSQPAKIAQDLDALARSALAAGDMAAHAGYVARLEDVRRGNGLRSR